MRTPRLLERRTPDVGRTLRSTALNSIYSLSAQCLNIPLVGNAACHGAVRDIRKLKERTE